MNEEKQVLIDVASLKKYFPVKGRLLQKKQFVQAVESVSFTIFKGETLGIVGESGCGKSTLGRTILNIITPTSGEVLFAGEDITKYDDFNCDKILLISFWYSSSCFIYSL